MLKFRLHSIIYKVIEEMEEAMKGMLDPDSKKKLSVKQLSVKPSRYLKWELSVDSWLSTVRLPVTLKSVLSVDGVVSMTVNLQA